VGVALVLPGRNDGPERSGLRLPALALAERGLVTHALRYEGGGEAAWAAARAGRWDDIVASIAPQRPRRRRPCGG
jgi:riboflavin biosynthesis pyrimidine reductase